MKRRITFTLVAFVIIAEFSAASQPNENKKISTIKSKKTLNNSNQVIIGEMNFIVSSAKITDDYMGVQGYRPNTADYTLLIINIELSGKTNYDSLKSIRNNCFVINNTNIKSMVSGEEIKYTRASGETSNKLSGTTWILSVPKISQSLKLILSRNKVINLDPLIDSFKKK